jgi:hypothetical protein
MEFINNTPFVFFREGWNICGCGRSCKACDIDLHMSKVFPGFCVDGIRVGKRSLYQCICGMEFSNSDDSENHITITESKCMINALKLDSRECKVCGLDFNGPAQLERHKKTRRHKNKIEQPLLCKVCNIRCLSAATLETHLKTKKHINRLNGPPLDLECKLCDIKCLSQKQMQAHLKTKKHLKKTDSLAISLTDTNN